MQVIRPYEAMEDVIGAKWNLRILRLLLDGPTRFSYLKESIPGLAASVLSRRLDHLINCGIVERVNLPEPAKRSAYGLTSEGEPVRWVLAALDNWGSTSGAIANNDGAWQPPPSDDLI